MWRGTGLAAQAALSEEQLRSQPEYGVAYELEMWKQAEMTKWRAEMRSRELERMSLLEGEWRRREKLRDTYDAHPSPAPSPNASVGSSGTQHILASCHTPAASMGLLEVVARASAVRHWWTLVDTQASSH